MVRKYCGMYSRCYAIDKYTTSVSEQELGKHVTAETIKNFNNIQAIARLPSVTTEELFGRCFLLSPPRGYITRTPGQLVSSSLETMAIIGCKRQTHPLMREHITCGLLALNVQLKKITGRVPQGA
jgi:hypothetical protein